MARAVPRYRKKDDGTPESRPALNRMTSNASPRCLPRDVAAERFRSVDLAWLENSADVPTVKMELPNRQNLGRRFKTQILLDEATCWPVRLR